ncbi:unnamed protein product, partial [Nesidiocoris tenuis]
MRFLRCSFVLIKKDDKFLFAKNNDESDFNHEKWTPLGGVVQANEDLTTRATV